MDKDDKPFNLEVRGRTLRDILRQADSLEDRLRLLPRFFDLCESVAKAHDLGFAIRNVHPGNVLVTETGDTLLVDWSLCRARGKSDPAEEKIKAVLRAFQDNRSPESGLPLLEAACLAPEIVLEHTEDIDARADVYSLGAILYEILTGRPIFPGSNGEVIQHAMTNSPEPISNLEPHAPQHLAGVCRRALHREPSARYTSARLLLDEARRLQNVNAATHPSSSGETLAFYNKAIGAAVVLLIVVGCAALLGWSKASRISRELDTVNADLGKKAADAVEAAEKLEAQLKVTEQARADAEAERDRDHEKLVAAVAAIGSLKADLDKTEKRRQIAELKVKTQAAEPATGTPADTPATPSPESDRAPQPAPSAEPPADGSAPSRPAPKPGQTAGLTRAELQSAVNALSECLKEEKAADGSATIVVRLAEGLTPAGVAALGFKDGDVITQVDRTQVASVEEARKALARSAREAGFSVRVTREGQSSWMRIAAREAPSPAPPVRKPAEPAQEKPEGEAAEQPPANAPDQSAQEEPAPETQEDAAQQAPEEQPTEEPADGGSGQS